jgi:hypothetical protein
LGIYSLQPDFHANCGTNKVEKRNKLNGNKGMSFRRLLHLNQGLNDNPSVAKCKNMQNERAVTINCGDLGTILPYLWLDSLDDKDMKRDKN